MTFFVILAAKNNEYPGIIILFIQNDLNGIWKTVFYYKKLRNSDFFNFKDEKLNFRCFFKTPILFYFLFIVPILAIFRVLFDVYFGHFWSLFRSRLTLFYKTFFILFVNDLFFLIKYENVAKMAFSTDFAPGSRETVKWCCSVVSMLLLKQQQQQQGAHSPHVNTYQ